MDQIENFGSFFLWNFGIEPHKWGPFHPLANGQFLAKIAQDNLVAFDNVALVGPVPKGHHRSPALQAEWSLPADEDHR